MNANARPGVSMDRAADAAASAIVDLINSRPVSPRREEIAAIIRTHVADEIAPVSIPQRRGEPLVISEDEGVRPETTVETLSKLRPAFVADGTITAGTSSPISDGAAAVVVMSRAKAEALGLSWIA